MTVALVDGDIVLYRTCWGKKEHSWQEVKESLDWCMLNILDAVGTRESITYISGEGNFRKWLYPEYKANRKDMEKPPNFEEAKEHLIRSWRAKISIDCETDDELAILHQVTIDSVICSIDKDFHQLPGKHFNFTKNHFTQVNEEMGMFNFYRQMLWGDASDNVKGIPGIGKKKSLDILFGKTTEERARIVREMYDDYNMDYELNKKLLWLPRTREYLEQLQEEAHQHFISQRSMESTTEPMEGSSEGG